MNAINRVIAKFQTKAAMCRAIGMSQQFLAQIERGDRPLPARFVLPIYRATGGAVTPHDLRPDIYPDPEWRPPLDAGAGSPGPGEGRDAGAGEPEKEAA